MAINYYDSFIKKLQEIFMMDHAELDFGIYRIMNQKRSEIEHFLRFELLPQVKTVLADAKDTSESEVFSHLVTFFGRYYDNGDFISKRRYKDNTYAIPYNGEEVKLHWANADQYYIKSSEYFRDYTFVLPTSRRKVHFVLKDVSTEQNNNKAANNMERRFALYRPETAGEPFYDVKEEELSIFFTYELMPKGTKQNDLMAEAFSQIKDIVPETFAELLTVKSPTEKNLTRTLLEKHLTDYTAKNSFDYFIHKDLGGFLRRELDFYIKNEVMLLDDLDVQHIESQLNIIKAIKQVGEKIIRMLAQLEDFQKKLWLKKKFVVQSDYCITLDRVPRKLYPEILANDRQREEWVRLFAIDEIKGDLVSVGYSVPLTLEFLEQNPFLVLDTAFFSKQFKHKLVAHLGDKGIDKQCNGLLINSENFQALELLQEKYANSVKCMFIDPPYNTAGDDFIYKDNFKESSWMSLMADRLLSAKNELSSNGVLFITIDDNEVEALSILAKQVFGKENHLATIIWQHSIQPKGYLDTFSVHHNYILMFKKTDDYEINPLERNDEDNKAYSNPDNDPKGPWRSGDVRNALYRPNLIYDIVSPSGNVIKPCDNGWRWSKETVEEKIKAGEIVFSKDETRIIRKIYLSNVEGRAPETLWFAKDVGSTRDAMSELKSLFEQSPFGTPKPSKLVIRAISLHKSDDCLVFDFFAGSGTTGEAVINQNRSNGNRKFILCEMAEYFKKVTKPRIEKVIYSPDWKDGKPVSRQGISQCFKYMRLEQYEDTLNNLKIKQPQNMMQFDDDSRFKESYMLEYMLDVETRDSLLNLQQFENPFAMTLKTTKDNELVETEVDMVETFNYLIGLNVETEDWYRDEHICVVQGHTHRDKLHTLVIWRNCQVIDNEQLNQFFERMDFRTRDSEFDLIYVNGDNTLPNLKRDEENWKVVLIEEEFTKRMFETE